MSHYLFAKDGDCYVMDTGFFVTCRSYYHENFPSFWNKMNEAVIVGKISSVKEVQKELENYGGEQEHLLNWIERHEHIFTDPTLEELDKTREIFKIPKFLKIVKNQARMQEKPVAVPFVIAKAWETRATLVTEESRKKEGKIPDVCEYFGVKCMNTEEFMKNEGWKF